jgi:hypothetical protein
MCKTETITEKEPQTTTVEGLQSTTPIPTPTVTLFHNGPGNIGNEHELETMGEQFSQEIAAMSAQLDSSTEEEITSEQPPSLHKNETIIQEGNKSDQGLPNERKLETEVQKAELKSLLGKFAKEMRETTISISEKISKWKSGQH